MSVPRSHESIVIGQLLNRMEALEQQREDQQEALKQEIQTLREELNALKSTNRAANNSIFDNSRRRGLERPEGEAGRTGKKGGKSNRKGFSVQKTVQETYPNINWPKLVRHTRWVCEQNEVTCGTIRTWGPQKIALLCKEVCKQPEFKSLAEYEDYWPIRTLIGKYLQNRNSWLRRMQKEHDIPDQHNRKKGLPAHTRNSSSAFNPELNNRDDGPSRPPKSPSKPSHHHTEQSNSDDGHDSISSVLDIDETVPTMLVSPTAFKNEHEPTIHTHILFETSSLTDDDNAEQPETALDTKKASVLAPTADTMLTHALQLGAKVFVDEYGWFWFENATIIPIDYSSPDYPFPEYPQYYLNLNKFPKNFDDYNKGFGDNIPRTTNTAGHWEVGEICDRKQLSELVAGQESHPIEIEDNTQVSGHATVLKKVKLVIHPPPTTRKRGRKPKVSPKRPRQPKRKAQTTPMD